VKAKKSIPWIFLIFPISTLVWLVFLALIFWFIWQLPRTDAAENLNVSGISFKTGKTIRVEPNQSEKALVVVVLSPRCPCSISHEAHLKDLFKKYSPKGIRFLGVHSNSNESFEEAKAHFNAVNLPFEVISDSDSKLADRFDALSTPHAFVISSSGKTLYLGGVSDSSQFSRAEKHYLEDALAAISQGQEPPVHQTRVLGCVIRRP